MIRTINGSDLIEVQQSSSYNNSVPIPYTAIPGSVWFDGDKLKVYTGSGWEEVRGNNVFINCSPQLKAVVDWAQRKMNEEARENELHQKFPALKQAKENYDLIRKMVAE